MRPFLSRSLLAAAVALLAAGCASDVAYRTPPATLWENCTGDRCSGGASLEHHEFQAERGGKTVPGSYMLGFVEFDDQGWYHDQAQQHHLFKGIQAYRDRHPGTEFLIVTYTHGWQHNASADDANVLEFRKLLERLALLEQHVAAQDGNGRRPRKVVGVYLGWRGKSVNLPLLETTSFWTRKNAGERVGNRSAKQFLMALNEFRAYLNGWDRSDKLATREQTQLIMIAHSFGGMLTYHALHTGIMERALKIEKDEQGRYRYGTARSFGDFVWLVNPAFEGADYEPLLTTAKARCYANTQRPVMAVVTSSGDWATKYAFPAGRLYTFTQSAPQDGERGTVLNTVGHLDRYITHDLVHDPRRSDDPKTAQLSPTDPDQAAKTVREIAEEAAAAPGTGPVVTHYDGAKATTREGVPPNYPYYVMLADTELIANHSDIWNDRFANFMTSFIAREVLRLGRKDSAPEPDARSCAPFGLGTETTAAR